MAQPAPLRYWFLANRWKNSHSKIIWSLQLPQTLLKKLLKGENQTVAPSASPVLGDIRDIQAYPYKPCRLLLHLRETEEAFEQGEPAWQRELLISREGQRCL